MAIDTEELLKRVRQLGGEFRKRDMATHLPSLRLYWLALQNGLTQPSLHRLEVSYSEELVCEWFKLLRLPPFERAYAVRPPGSPCPQCPRQEGHALELVTEKTFPDGRKVACLSCKSAWLELSTPGWVQRVGQRAPQLKS